MARTPLMPVAIRDSVRRLTLPRPRRFRATAAFAPAAAAGVVVFEKRLPVLWEKQWKTEWCWAAVSVMLARFYFPNQPIPSQCELATAVFREEDPEIQCCPVVSPVDPVGNVPQLLTHVLPKVRLRSELGDRYSFADVRAKLHAEKALVALIHWEDSGKNHFVIIDGVGDLDGTAYLHVSDPDFGPMSIPYAELADVYSPVGENGPSGTWEQTHLVTRTGG